MKKSILQSLGLLLASLVVVIGAVFSHVGAASAETVTVKMGSDSGQLAFVPKVVEISVGDTVKWVNNKAFPHNVVINGHPELSHKKLAQKPKLELASTFTEPGEYSYYCSPHRGAGMQGKVIVK
jgi:plastocyanin